jgi:hypothetical protein
MQVCRQMQNEKPLTDHASVSGFLPFRQPGWAAGSERLG